MNKQKLIELRCKAWGITEDEYYCNQCSDFSLEDMARAYRRGKNKGKAETALLSQHILDLQKDKGNLTDKVKELEQELIEADNATDVFNAQEKRIVELEKENKVLAQNLEDTEILNKTYEKRFDDLEKENAELKEDNSEWEKASDKWKSVYELTNKQLTKAKEIISEFMKYEINEYDGSLEIHFEELKKQAEQFLKDCEVEK